MVAATLLAATDVPIRAELKTDSKAIGGAPILAEPTKAQVMRGTEVRITLPTSGPGSIREIRIRRQPRHGTLSAPQFSSGGQYYVIYQNNAEDEATQDSFAFAVRSARGVSAPADVTIEIQEAPGILQAPEVVDFGEVVPGKPATKEIVISNRGGGRLRGELQPTSPWRLDGSGSYFLKVGESTTFTLILDPGHEGTITGTLDYGQNGRAAELRANVVPPLRVSPATIVLSRDGVLRSGSFSILNQSGAPVRMEIAYGSRLTGERQLEVPPGENHPVSVMAVPGDSTPIDEVIQVVAGGTILPVRVQASAAPTQPQSTPEPAPEVQPSASPIESSPLPPAPQAVGNPLAPSGAPAPAQADSAGPVLPGDSLPGISIPGIRALSKAKDSAWIDWKTVPLESGSVAVEERILSLDPAGDLEINWSPLPHSTPSQIGQRTQMQVTGLSNQPLHSIRVVIQNPIQPRFSDILTFATVEKERFRFSWLGVLLISTAALITLTVFVRFRTWREFQRQMYGK